MRTFASVDDAIAAYRSALVEMDSISLARDGGGRQWNRKVQRVQHAQLFLRDTEEGRAAISALIEDPVSTVAHWAASHSLFWEEPAARRLLENERSNELLAFDAKMTLQEFDGGRLRHDWIPKVL